MMQNAILEYKRTVIKAMTPRAQSALEAVQTKLSSNRPEFLLTDPDKAFERIRWCQKLIEQVRARVRLDIGFMGHFAVTLDQAWALSVVLEESTEELEALYSFAVAVTNELFQTAQELLQTEDFKSFEVLIHGDRQSLTDFISSQTPSTAGTLLAQIFVFDLASTANTAGDNCQDFESQLETTLRAVLYGEVIQA
jgi:hypothetical protein